MRVFRMCNIKYAGSAHLGLGAKRTGARWNDPGLAAIYTAEHESLALLEILVHLLPSSEDRVKKYVCVPVEVPDGLITVATTDRLPVEWRTRSDATRAFGSQWLQSNAGVALSVPSAVVTRERNLMLNPSHPHFSRVAFGEPWLADLDPRLTGTVGISALH